MTEAVADLLGQPLNGDLLVCTDVVNAEVLALGDDLQHPVDQIVDVHEGARLVTAALNRKTDDPRRLPAELAHPDGELRDNMVNAHVGPIDVMRAEDGHPVEESP